MSILDAFGCCNYILRWNRIFSVHRVDKEAFLKGNAEVDPVEVVMDFDRSPTYVVVVEKVMVDLKWNDPSEVVELKGRHNVWFGMHIRWKTMPFYSEQHLAACKEMVNSWLHFDLNRDASPLQARNTVRREPLVDPDVDNTTMSPI
jgi:hypothetical protein